METESTVEAPSSFGLPTDQNSVGLSAPFRADRNPTGPSPQAESPLSTYRRISTRFPTSLPNRRNSALFLKKCQKQGEVGDMEQVGGLSARPIEQESAKARASRSVDVILRIVPHVENPVRRQVQAGARGFVEERMRFAIADFRGDDECDGALRQRLQSRDDPAQPSIEVRPDPECDSLGRRAARVGPTSGKGRQASGRPKWSHNSSKA